MQTSRYVQSDNNNILDYLEIHALGLMCEACVKGLTK